MLKKFQLFFFFLLSNPFYIFGSNAFSYLNLSPSPEAEALGSAYAAVAGGPESIFFNPAGLSSLKETHLYTQSYLPPFLEETKYHNFVWAQPSFWGVWALHSGIFYVNPFTRTVADASVADGYREAGDFTTYDLQFSVSGARMVMPNLAVGTTFRFLRESLGDLTAHGFAMDLGLHYSATYKPVRYGLAVQNLGPNVQFKNDSFRLPLTFKGGIALTQTYLSPFPYIPNGTLLSVELQKVLYGGESIHSGLEIPVAHSLKIRSGYKYSFKKQYLASQWVFPNGFSLGLGISKGDWSFDYSTSSLGDLGLVHQVALDLRWQKFRGNRDSP